MLAPLSPPLLHLNVSPRCGVQKGRRRATCLAVCASGVRRALSFDTLHRRLDDGVSLWLEEALEEAKDFFEDGLEAKILVDETWHLRGAAGGAHPSLKRIVVDPSVHICYRDLAGTLLHEMLHLQLADLAEEHGPGYVQGCLDLNRKIAASDCACFCRLGEFDTALDPLLLARVGLPRELCEAFPMRHGSWDAGLLAGDLVAMCRQAGIPKDDAIRFVQRVQCESIISSCKRALQLDYTTWALKSRTMARFAASQAARDYQMFSDYEALWSL